MSDDRVEQTLRRSIERRVRRVDPRPDGEDLLARLERRHARRTRRVLVGGAVLVVVAAALGFLAGDRGSGPRTSAVAVADGLPEDIRRSTAAPRDVDAAITAIIEAYHEAYDGGTPPAARAAAVQDGPALAPLQALARQFALDHGYTSAQLAGTTVAVSDVTFLDRSHALVHFTLTIPDRGSVFKDRIGYAVFDDGRWRVALRTACDVLSLNGLGQACPPPGI